MEKQILEEREKRVIQAVIEVRRDNNMTQAEMSRKCGMKQPVIARMEKFHNSPRLRTLLRVLAVTGHTLAVIPLGNAKAAPERRMKGLWEEKNVCDDKNIIEEWQSARCSVCGKYHTTPYMYYFNNYNFCPNCGADMRGDENERPD